MGKTLYLLHQTFQNAYNAVTRENTTDTRCILAHSVSLYSFLATLKNFRKKISPDYKGHRNRKKPCGYKRVIRNLKIQYDVCIMPELEADDAMGIYATKLTGNIIVSPDKDMRQIPGKLYNLEDTTYITPEEGARWHLIQTLAGDQTDGYSGVPGIGVKRAETLFNKEGYSWQTVIKAFEDKD